MSLFAGSPPKAKPPAVEQFSMPNCAEGLIIGDLLGVGKYSGNILWYGGSRSKKIKEKQKGGKGGGGSSKIVVGYKYYLSWMLGLCIGPVDALYSVWSGEDLLWEGELARPVSGGVSSISLSNMGTAYFYFGTTDQSRQATMDSTLGAINNHPSRNLCYVFFDDCLLGESNRVPAVDFVIGKYPEYSWSEDHRIGPYGYNPAQAIYYIINEHTELPIALIDEDSFAAAATTLHGEGRGIKVNMADEQTGMKYIEEILTHIDSSFFYADNSKFKLKLLRGDEDTDDVSSFEEVDFIQAPRLDRDSYTESVNEVKVEFLAVDGVDCPGVALQWDEDNNPETIAQSTSESVFVTGGVAPYRWSVTGGLGHSMQDYITVTGTSVLVASASSCGGAVVKCIDACGTEITGEVRNVTGVWVSKGNICGLYHEQTVLDDWDIDCIGSILEKHWPIYADIIRGNKRQVQDETMHVASYGHGEGTEEYCNGVRDGDCGAMVELDCLAYPAYMTLTKPPGTCGTTVRWQAWYYECGVGSQYYGRSPCEEAFGVWSYRHAYHNDQSTLNYLEWECA